MKKRKLFLTIQSVLCVLLAVLPLSAAARILREGLARKEADPLAWIYTRERVIKALYPVLLLLILSLVTAAAGLRAGARDPNAGKPSEALREQILKDMEGSAAQDHDAAKTVRTVLLILALALIAAGTLNGSARDVFGKAVNICTECIGLG